MNPQDLDALVAEIERQPADEVMALLVPYGLSPRDRAALLDSVGEVCAELRRRGHVPEVTTRRVPNGEVYALAIDDMAGL